MLICNSYLEELEERDPTFNDAIKILQNGGYASSSYLQRSLKLGYARAARLLDQLQTAGIVGPGMGAKPRDILIPHRNAEGVEVVPKPTPESKAVFKKEPPLKWKKTKYAESKSNNFEINVGTDGNKKPVSLDLKRYGNLIMIGSQITNISELLNQIIAEQVRANSPEDLKLLVIDGFINHIELPKRAPHLLAPVVVDSEKVVSALKWLQIEISRRVKENCNLNNLPKILLVIHGLNEIINYSPKEIEDRIALILSYAKSSGVYIIITADYLDKRFSKWIQANSGAKIVFRPTTKQMARSSGIPESIKLISPDEAILETMFEGKKKITINKINPKKIYEEIFG